MERPVWIYLALVVLLGAAFFVRVRAGGVVVMEDGSLWFSDNDTVRRLEKLRHLVDPAKPYPYVNPKEGHPIGATIHWTLPMDGAILALDPLVAWAYPQAKPHEAGALWIGPVLGTLAVLVFFLLARRLFDPPWAALLATALFAFAAKLVNGAAYGNGDHQTLQSVCAVAAVLAFALVATARGGTGAATLCGLALGASLWVTTETLFVAVLMAVAAALQLVVLAPDERRAATRHHLTWSSLALAVVLVADACEHSGGWPTFEWDKVSGFQAWPLAAFTVFLALLPFAQRRVPAGRVLAPAVAAAAALLLAVGLPLAVPAFRAAFTDQVESFRAANHWVQNTVSEYRPLFFDFGTFLPSMIGLELGDLAYAFPLWLYGWFRAQDFPLPGRVALGALSVGLLAFTCKEVKLAHLFLITYPLVLVAGGHWCLRAVAPHATPGLLAAGGLAAVVLTLFRLPVGPAELMKGERAHREMCAALTEARTALDPDDDKRAVMAMWDPGAKFMYYANAPVMASGYHRNLGGIHDSYWLFTRGGWAEVADALAKRKVRFIVSEASPETFPQIHMAVPAIPPFGRAVGASRDPDGVIRQNWEVYKSAYSTLLWYLMFYPSKDPHFEPVFASTLVRRLNGADGRPVQVPVYRLWRVRYPGEK